jgi:predicted DNA-binding transcriptional regulator AlpA
MPKQSRSIVVNDFASEESPFLSVEEAAELLKSSPSSLYLYLSNTGSKGGKKRKRFPLSLYVRLGRRVLFIKSKLLEWILDGAEFKEA